MNYKVEKSVPHIADLWSWLVNLPESNPLTIVVVGDASHATIIFFSATYEYIVENCLSIQRQINKIIFID